MRGSSGGLGEHEHLVAIVGELAFLAVGVIFGVGIVEIGDAFRVETSDFSLVVDPVGAERKGVGEEGGAKEVGVEVTHIEGNPSFAGGNVQPDFRADRVGARAQGGSRLVSRRDRWLGQCFLVVCSSLCGGLCGLFFKCGDLSGSARNVGERAQAVFLPRL